MSVLMFVGAGGLLASLFGCITLDQNIPNLARRFRHHTTPVPKAPMGVYRLRPFLQITPFDIVLLWSILF
jgi:hypothetical protein